MKLHKFLCALLIVFSAMVSCAGAYEDNFLYGVQIFSRPFDWTSPYDAQAQKAGQTRFLELLNYALSLNVDIIRGGTTYDNMSDHASENNNAGKFRGMNFLLPVIRDNGLILDWVITGTSQSNLSRMEELMTLAGEHVKANSANVIYEIWNEPDLKYKTFWSGTAEEYYNSFLSDSSQAIRTADPDAQIMNGGLVLDPNDSDKTFFQPAIDALRAGKISMLAMHSHNNLARFCELWETEISANMGADVSKVLLNECGASMNHNYTSRENAAMNLIGKLLKAKSFGAGGFIVFQLGGLTSSESPEDSSSDPISGYALIDFQPDGSLVPNTSYYALKTAIKYTKGLKYSDRVTAADGYTLLFEDEDTGRKTLAGIGRRPSQSEINAAFGSDGYDAEYDLTGNRILDGSEIDSDNIVYIVVEPAIAISITTSSTLPEGTAGKTYSQTFETDSEEAVTWSHISGDIPSGLTLDNSTGKLSGTPSIAGTFTFTIRAANQNSSTSKIFTLTVKLNIITDSVLPDATVGTPYTQNLSAEGASSITWKRTDGKLPEGLDINSSGTIFGTPTTAGSYDFTVEANAGNNITAAKSFRITVISSDKKPESPITPIITTDPLLPSGTVDIFYTTQLSSSVSNASWDISSGNLPGGLSLSTAGVISGTPTVSGTFSFTVRASNGTASSTKNFSITVNSPTSISIMPQTLSSGIVGSEYTASLSADVSGVTWSVSSGDRSGSLPAGLTLNPSTGVISGTPTEQGTFTFIVFAEKGSRFGLRRYTLKIARFAITTDSLPSGSVGSPYSYHLQANGPVSRWSIDVNCPDWLTLDRSTGAVYGTPTRAGDYTLTVRAENSYAYDVKSFTISVSGSSGGVVGSSSGGGGCDSGFGLFGILALLILKRR